MTIDEAKYILYNLTYNEYVNQLKEKYSNVPGDYFYTVSRGKTKGQLAKNTGITRGKDGLYIHHVYECYFLGLSDPTMYLLQNAMSDTKIKDAQKAENLVYCNLIEHLILHIKIALEFNRGAEHVGIDFITGDLNRLYELGDQNLIESTYNAPNQRWKQTVYKLIKDDYDIYVMLGKIIINDLGISKDLVCNVTFYNTCYQKLYKDLGNVDTSKYKKSILDTINSIDYHGMNVNNSYHNYRKIMKQFSDCDDLDILYALLDKAYFDTDKSIIVYKILDIDSSIDTLVNFSNSTDLYVRTMIAEKENCPIDILEKLSKDKSATVRVAVVNNKNTPNNIIDNMRTDNAKTVIKALELRDKKFGT